MKLGILLQFGEHPLNQKRREAYLQVMHPVRTLGALARFRCPGLTRVIIHTRSRP